jgi:hypothetical protein
MEHYTSLGALVVAFVALILASLGKRAGLVVAAADVVLMAALPFLGMLGPRMVTGEETEAVSPAGLALGMAWPLVWTAILVVVGFGFEPFLRRLGVGIYRLDRQVMMGAAIGMIVVLFAAPGGMSTMVLGAFLGALAGGLFGGTAPGRAARDALGSLLGLFGADGIRLMCTLAIVSLIARGLG